jgi:Arc/MetJ-type ribon-helix-helix transcriptional regulator
MNAKRTHVVLSDQLVKDIDKLVGSRRRSSFLTEAAEEKLMRMRQIKALDQLIPWSEHDHPELKQGAAKWVSKLRRQDEERFKKIAVR